MNDKNRIKIKDLAQEFGMEAPILLAKVREEQFNAKNASVYLEPEMVQSLRKKYGKEPEPQKQDVIVRRRRKPANREEAAPAHAKDREKGASQTTQDAKNHAASTHPQQERPARGRTEKPARMEVTPAKVISRPSDKTASPAVTPAQATRIVAPAEAKAPEKPQEVPAAAEMHTAPAPEKTVAEATPQKPAASAQPNAAETPAPSVRIVAPAEPKSEAKSESATPKVKIISRPTQTPRRDSRPASRDGGDSRGGQRRDGQQRPSRPAQGRPGGFRPGGQPSAGRDSEMDFGGGEPVDSRNGQSKKKRNKGRRTVDFQSSGFGHHQEERDAAPRVRSKGHRKGGKQVPMPQTTQPLKAAKRKLRIENAIRVSDMAHQMGLKANELIKVLFNLGIMATINQSIDFDTAVLVASEFNYEVEKTGFEEKDYLEVAAPDKPEDLKPRPPVVTIMGHVDHGKTSLLDAIRKTHVTSGEAGGITQHIGAYHVKTKKGDIVFLDTPGHEAFTAMRARGAQITDLVILVVAADDGVMEQTREAVNHSRAAGVPIIVAVNKIDKPGANPDRVMRELSEIGLQPEAWGGDTIFANVSAKTHEGLDDLLELVALQSEVMELTANPNKPARGHIVEAKLDKGRGPVATVLIQEGTLHQGDNFVCGTFSGRVRALLNDQGKKVREAGPSIPVEVQGFEGVPEAGEEFNAVTDEKVARRIADARSVREREKALANESKVTLETFLASSGDDDQKTLNLVLKADVQGTLEAIAGQLKKTGTDKVAINVVHGGTGAITESDILLASASRAIIIGFNIRPTAKIKDIAAHESVDIRFYDIIYKLIDDVKNAMAGLLTPIEKEVYLGQAEVRQTFSLSKVGTIAGSYVTDGKIARNAGIRLLRDGVVIYTGHVASLKRFKDDAKEVVRGNECGIGLENYNDIKVGDIIEAFDTVQEAATL